MCCTTTTAGHNGESPFNIILRAVVPPVDAPIATTFLLGVLVKLLDSLLLDASLSFLFDNDKSDKLALEADFIVLIKFSRLSRSSSFVFILGLATTSTAPYSKAVSCLASTFLR